MHVYISMRTCRVNVVQRGKMETLGNRSPPPLLPEEVVIQIQQIKEPAAALKQMRFKIFDNLFHGLIHKTLMSCLGTSISLCKLFRQ
jgi:hypothetical protein